MTEAPALLAAAAVAATAPWQAHAVRRVTCAPPHTTATVLAYAAASGLLTLALALRLPAAAVAPALPLAAAGLSLAVIDARCHRLPDRLVGGTLLAITGTLVAVAAVAHEPGRLGAAIVGGVTMAGFYALFFVITAVVGSSVAAYGPGDIKLAMPLGAALGWLGPFPWFAALLGAHLLYLAVHGTRALAGRTGWRDRHAFGPAMLLAAALAAAYAPQ